MMFSLRISLGRRQKAIKTFKNSYDNVEFENIQEKIVRCIPCEVAFQTR
jgi:hypothetical protein